MGHQHDRTTAYFPREPGGDVAGEAAPRQRHVPLDRAACDEDFADLGNHRSARVQLMVCVT